MATEKDAPTLGAATNVQGSGGKHKVCCQGGMVQLLVGVQPPAQGGGRRTGCWHAACITSACAGPRR